MSERKWVVNIYESLNELDKDCEPYDKGHECMEDALRGSTPKNIGSVNLSFPFKGNDLFDLPKRVYRHMMIGFWYIRLLRAGTADPHRAFVAYLAARDKLFPFHNFLWLRADGSIPTWAWFSARLWALYPDSISGHSLRVGGATSLAASGVLGDQIQAMGHWSSDFFRIYICKNPALLHAIVFNGQSIHDPVFHWSI